MPAERLPDFDTFLWTYRDDSFLPHGRDDEPLAEHHPIRLSASAESCDGADIAILVDGTEIADLTGAERCIFVLLAARWARAVGEKGLTGL